MKTQRGFTLIELLIVVGIIAILAAIALPNMLEAQIRAKVARVRADLRTVATALESYAVAENKYPPMIGVVGGANIPAQPAHVNNGYGSGRDYGWRGLPPQLTTPVAYLTSLPSDPFKRGASHNYPPDIDKPYESGNVFDMALIYHSIQQYTELDPVAFDAGDLNDYGHWRMYSIGPDKTIDAIGTADRTLGWLYDPSNGTISTGEILRTHADPTGARFTRF